MDEYVIGQEKAKKILAVAVYNHYSRVNENLRQLQIQESLTAISNSSLPPTNPAYYNSSVLMSDGPSTPDPIIETFTSPSSPPSTASGTDTAGGSSSSNSGKETHPGNNELHAPGRRKSTPFLPSQFETFFFHCGQGEQSCENSNLPDGS